MIHDARRRPTTRSPTREPGRIDRRRRRDAAPFRTKQTSKAASHKNANATVTDSRGRRRAHLSRRRRRSRLGRPARGLPDAFGRTKDDSPATASTTKKRRRFRRAGLERGRRELGDENDSAPRSARRAAPRRSRDARRGSSDDASESAPGTPSPRGAPGGGFGRFQTSRRSLISKRPASSVAPPPPRGPGSPFAEEDAPRAAPAARAA